MTDIVPAPDIPLSSEFPTGADRTAGIFNAKSAGWADTSRTMAAAMDAAAESAQTNAIAANERAVAASQSAQDAEQSRQAAESARDRAEGAAVVVGRFDKLYLGSKSSFPTLDNEGDPLQIGAEFFHDVLKARYSWDGAQWLIGTNVTAGVTQINGEAGAVILKTIGGVSLLGAGNIEPSTLYRSPRTSNVQLVASDKSKLIDITAGTFTQTFAAAATLGDGWFCYLRNSGTGDITLDPDGAELIDGLTGYVMYPGEVRLVQCDGAALGSVVISGYSRTFTASGMYTKPPGYSYHGGLVWNGGGSGRKASAGAPGGGGGGCLPFQLPASAIGTTETVTIGAGGAAQTTADTSGNIGGASSFGSLIVMPASTSYSDGSNYPRAFSAAPVGFESSNETAVDTIYGGMTSGSIVNAGKSLYGGGCGGAVNASGTLFTPGTSKIGGSGGAAGDAASGSDGVAPGGGGGATRTGARSGAGARGEVRIWGII